MADTKCFKMNELLADVTWIEIYHTLLPDTWLSAKGLEMPFSLRCELKQRFGPWKCRQEDTIPRLAGCSVVLVTARSLTVGLIVTGTLLAVLILTILGQRHDLRDVPAGLDSSSLPRQVVDLVVEGPLTAVPLVPLADPFRQCPLLLTMTLDDGVMESTEEAPGVVLGLLGLLMGATVCFSGERSS